MLIDGKQISKKIMEELSSEIKTITSKLGRAPYLSIILIGNNPASEVYVREKLKACKYVGIFGNLTRFDSSASEEEIESDIKKKNDNKDVDGILLQLPLPDHLDSEKLIEFIDPNKDVDGLTTENIGLLVSGNPRFVPATPLGIIELINRMGVELKGRNVVIVGRSKIVGRPLSIIMSGKGANSNATVTLCHSWTSNLIDFTSQADVLIVSTGSANTINGSMIKKGAIVIDVGINKIEDQTKKSGYRLVGDVDFDSAKTKASMITPVPGGVGPMTIAMLMKNVSLSTKL